LRPGAESQEPAVESGDETDDAATVARARVGRRRTCAVERSEVDRQRARAVVGREAVVQRASPSLEGESEPRPAYFVSFDAVAGGLESDRPGALRAQERLLGREDADVAVAGDRVVREQVTVRSQERDPDPGAGPEARAVGRCGRVVVRDDPVAAEIVQCAMPVEAIVGVASRFAAASQVPSCGGGGSLNVEFSVSPIVLSRSSESSPRGRTLRAARCRRR
jgi:hypothetical protein